MFDWLRRLLGAAGGAVNNAVNTAGRFVQQNNPVNQWQQVQRQLPQVQRQIQRQIQPYIPRIQPPTPPPQLRQIQNLNIPRLANISADTARNVLGNIGKGYTNFAKQQEAKFRSDINLARNNPATFAVSKTSLLGAVAPFLDTSPVKLPKVDFTGYVDRSGDRIANTNVGRNPIVGFAGQNIVKPIIRSGARVADVMQGQEQYAPGIKGIAQLSTDAFNVGSLAYTPAKAGQLALGGKAALRVAPSAALRGAGAGAGISTLNQYADTGRINPTDVALSGLLGGVANVALPVAGGYAGRGLQRAGTAAKPIARELRLDTGGFAKLPGKNNPIDPLESLKAEARKYKSAEEFVKAQGEPVYHRSPNKFSEFDISKVSNDTNRQRGGWGLYFSDAVDAIPEDAYGKYLYEVQAPKGTLLDTKNPVDEKIVSKIVDAVRVNGKNPSELSEFSYNGYLFYKTLSRILGGDKEASLFLSKNGIDGLKRTISPTANDYILFNDKSIKTKQQLTDLYNQAQVGKTTQATLKQANELVEPQATQLDRMGAVSAPQTLSKTGVDISSQADNTPISLKIKGQMSDANYLKRFGKERGAVKIKIKPFTPEDYAFERWKDRGALSLGRETLERNLDRVAGKDAPKVKKFLVEQSRNNEFQRAQFLNSKRGEVKNYIVDQLGIKPRSKESALVQKYGEGLIDDVQLNQEAGARAPQIAEAASYFRSQYDELLDQWNAVRTRYGYDEVPKRQDYFRHFKEINDNIMQLGMIPKSRDLPTSISGITDIFRPNKPFSNAELRRYTNETTFDAVGGFDNYLDSVSRQIFHTDTVQRGRYVENAIRKQAEDNPEIELPNFVANLGEWTNLVSGKKTRIDRASEQLLGRKVYGLMDALRRKTSANMVGANLSSAMSNFIPFTQSISTTSKPSVIKGMMSSATSPLRGDVNSIDGEVSSYLTRRFAKDAIVKVKGAKAADIASTPFKWVDEFTSRSIVAGKYYENLSKGLNSKEAMKAADDYASKVITDRSIGQLPNLMNTKTIGFITQFQAEINNQVSFLMRDIPELAGGNKVKIANMLGQFVVFSYLFNTGYEKVMGRRPQIDPIQAGIDMYQALNADNDDTTSEKVISGLKKAGDRIATGLPFVSVFTGGRLPVNAMLPDVPALTKGIGSIGSPEGTQWGQFYKGVSGPAFYGLPPFGGGQAKKTLEGLYSYSKGESTTPAGRQRFEVAQTPANLAKSLVFGQYSTDEGKQYIKQLGENQSGQGGGSKDKEYLKAFDAGERKFLSMTKKEQEEYLKQDQRFNGTKEKYRIWKIDQEGIDLPEGISDQSRDVLTQLAKTSERDKKAFKDKNLYAVELAEYEKDKLEGKLNDIEDGKRIKSLQRNKVYNDFDPLVRDLYSLNKTEFFRYIKNNPNGKALFAQAVALDDALVAIGLKSKLRNKYGQILEPGVRVARAKKGRSKKGGGKGRKGGVAKTGVVRLKSPKLRLSMSVVPPKVGKVSLKTSPKLRPASAKPVAKLSRVGSVKVRSNA